MDAGRYVSGWHRNRGTAEAIDDSPLGEYADDTAGISTAEIVFFFSRQIMYANMCLYGRD